jgi:type IV pilus assembly protein PilW
MRTPQKSRGFSIVELMVGMLIGLIAIIVMFQVFAVSEGQKRTTTGAGDAQQNGVFSLFQIERDTRMAGFGINNLVLLGCQTNGWYVPSGQAFTFQLLPISITNGAAGAPDQITIAYGDADLYTAPQKISNDILSVYKVRDRYGFRAGDIIVAAQAGRACSVAQVSGLPDVPNALDVQHSTGTFTNAQGQAENVSYNRVGGLPPPANVTYTPWADATNSGGRLFNLGAKPAVIRYSIQNSQLVATDLLQPGVPEATVVLSDGVVQMQAQYGFDGNNDGRVDAPTLGVATISTTGGDQWGDSMPAGAVAADWAKVIAVRMVVVSRSMTPERPDPGTGVCNTTVVNPTWGAAGVALDITAAPDWRCFRYRPFEVIVPIRNMVWFPQ